MRLKEDSSSYKGMGLKVKLQPVPDAPIVRSKKKNTKLWCEGKIGRPHDVMIVGFRIIKAEEDPYWPNRDICHMEWKCSNCGKQWSNWIDR